MKKLMAGVAVVGFMLFGSGVASAENLKCYSGASFRELTEMGWSNFQFDNVKQRSTIKYSKWGDKNSDQISLIDINYNGRNWLLLVISPERYYRSDYRVCVLNNRRLLPAEMEKK